MSIEVPIGGKNTRLGAEQNTTPVAGGNDTVLNTTNTYYSFFTMPTTAALYRITGVEWLNGTVVNGGVQPSIHYVDANPPTSAVTKLAAWFGVATQTGVSAVQRVSVAGGGLVEGGAILGAAIVSSSATGRFGTTTQGSANRLKAIAYNTNGDLAMGSNGTAWSAGTEEPYIKVYYKAVL